MIVLPGSSIWIEYPARAVAASSSRAAVWSLDRDFRRIKAVYPQLELYESG